MLSFKTALKICLTLVVLTFARFVLAQSSSTLPAEITKTFTAKTQTRRWDGWAKDDRSIPGWGNKPPEPGTVEIVTAKDGQPRVFSGHVDGVDSYKDADVGVVSLTYIYWNRKDAYHWVRVENDGTFNVTDDKYLRENKAVVLRAPKHPWTFLSYIFKGNEGGKEIVLHADPGKAVRFTADVEKAASKDFGVEFFALHSSWIHENNPIGYQWASRNWTPDNSDGNLVLYLPLHPIAVYVSADGGANDWEIVDARQADHFHFALLPAARFNLIVTKDGSPAAKTSVLMGNENAALSLRGGSTDGDGKWTAGSLPPGRWWIKIGKQTSAFDLMPKQSCDATFDLDTGTLSIDE